MKKHELDRTRLQLGRETLLPLERDALAGVAGGIADPRTLSFVRYCGSQE